MDISEQYIKMCDRKEIQDGHEWLVGDFFAYIHSEQWEKTFLHFDILIVVEFSEGVLGKGYILSPQRP